jgi:insulysin
MDVCLGQFNDLDHLPGLAHFLEHMLFMETEKYPDEKSYNEYLSQNGGSLNAYMDKENTNYYFNATER